MLRSLFARLTADPARGATCFAAATRIARDPSLYREAGVPDTLDGRFAALTTVIALILVRVEREGERGEALSVALSERFVEAMDAEHRELGVSDPAIGKTVRKLVASLGQRIELWRAAILGKRDWAETSAASIPGADAARLAPLLRALSDRLDARSIEQIATGAIE